jgi:hypothetical protein
MTAPTPKRLRMDAPSEQAEPLEHKYTSDFDKADSVTLVVGPQKHELLAHARFITPTSEFFKSALKKEWLEGQTRILHLYDENVRHVVMYFDFIYIGNLPRYQVHGKRPEFAILETVYQAQVHLYALAQRLMDNTTKNAVLREICDTSKTTSTIAFYDLTHNCSPGVLSINSLYRNTLEEDPARRLVVDMHVQRPQELDPTVDPTFLLDLAQAHFQKALGDRSPRSVHIDVTSYMA